MTRRWLVLADCPRCLACVLQVYLYNLSVLILTYAALYSSGKVR